MQLALGCLPDLADFGLGNTGAVPLKGRPGSSWRADSPLIVEPLLKQEGNILGLHLTSQHLLVIHAASAAAAVWLDSNTLEPAQQLALPPGISYVWAEYGAQKMLISTCLGDVYTMSAQPQASYADTSDHELVSVMSIEMLCKFRSLTQATETA